MSEKTYNPSNFEEGLGAAAIAACLVSSPLSRRWYCRWGASEAEVNMALPGDELVSDPVLQSTRAITIQAPASAIWPWLVQLGQGRGGFYSYQRLENLAGCDIHNADRILLEHQNLNAGDQVRLGPEGYPAFEVAAIELDTAIILRGDLSGQEGTPTTWIWIFALRPVDEGTTRLLLRTRLIYAPSFANSLTWRFLTDPISFNMERKMLQGIKVRAEGTNAS